MTQRPTEPADSQELLRETLDTLASHVRVTPGAYHQVRAEWIRRQRRRRRLGVLTATLLVALADAVGLWALNRSDTGNHLIFDDRPPSQHREPVSPRIGQP
ncbi:MAG: hypothetical protein AVDCRST_MAG32-552 [uncultured Nocardioides sp.]|uniref:Uncharacterized protein n=1 Tax=uncultured Nocardioides sp. TaxID=198441 RepID=A0A6J4N2T4_9ACTN|nr:MAG: hypothetical protein AVDCRST_MAG32-552 [uncultured Nocardioides sp.]